MPTNIVSFPNYNCSPFFLWVIYSVLPGLTLYRTESSYLALGFVTNRPKTVGDKVYFTTESRISQVNRYDASSASGCDRDFWRIKKLNSLGTDSERNSQNTFTPDEISEIVASNIREAEGDSSKDELRQRFPEAARIRVHAPRRVNKNIKTRYKYNPIAKIQGLPNDDDKTERYTFSSHLHICGGSERGRRLCVPPVYLRPMMSRVKTALFSTLKHMGLFAYGFECKVIDLFCGSGSVGLEALSHGAAHCTFVDLSLQCCKATAMNVEHCKFEEKVRIVRADATESVASPWLHSITDKFDLLTACPPYEEVVYMELMKQIANTTILKPNSVVVIEYPKEIDYLPWSIEEGELLGYRNRKYGRTVVAIYVYKPTGSLLTGCEKGKREFVPTSYSRKRLKIEGFIPKPDTNAPLSC